MSGRFTTGVVVVAESTTRVDTPMVRVTLEDQRVLAIPDVTEVLAAVDQLWVTAFILGAYHDGLPRDVERSYPGMGSQVQGPFDAFLRQAGPRWLREVMSLPLAARPAVRLGLQSPLWIELVHVARDALTVTAPSVVTWGILKYSVKHPRKIGGAIPRILESWHQGWSDADRAARERVLHHWTEYPFASTPATSALILGEIAVEAQEAGRRLDAAGVAEVTAAGPGSEWEPPA